jgi:REP-associated tyrosine transposase
MAWPVRHRGAVARAYRLLEPGGIYHVTTSAAGGLFAFRNDGDRLYFLQLLDRIVTRHRWLCQAYCLLGTHYHLLLETPAPDLSDGMHRLNGIYAQRFNKHHERRGHLFGDRFTSVRVTSDGHLLHLSRYIALNPVRAGLCTRPENWEWSSYAAAIGLRMPPAFLDTDGVLRRFGRSRNVARRRLRTFVEEELQPRHGV